MLPRTRSALVFLPLLLLAAGAVACRQGKTQSTFAPIATPAFGTGGCSGPDQAFGSVLEVWADPSIGPMSQIAGSSATDEVYLTGADGSVRALDFTASASSPSVRQVVAPGEVDTLLGGVLPTPPPAVLSGIAVLDPSNLVVVEHTSNTILIVSLVNPSPVGFFVGFPDLTPGSTDGIAGASRFSFPAGTPAQIVASGDGRLFVADPGNHAVREVALGQIATVSTLAGLGVPASIDGPTFQAGFDTPTGLAISCGGELLVTESGPGGERLRAIAPGQQSFFGPPSGSVVTLAGDGRNLTLDGVGTAASLAGPASPIVTSSGDVYWMDTSTGILRRQTLATGVVDCPLFADCVSANTASGSFSGAGKYALAQSASGRLYVLDGIAGKLFLVQP